MIDRIINPYSTLLLILFIFVVVWYFCSDDVQLEYKGLNELYPEYIEEETFVEPQQIINIVDPIEQQSLLEGVTVDNQELSVQLVDHVKIINNYDLLPERVDSNFNIDLTPEIPPEFLENFCYVKSNTGNKFESKGENYARQVLETIYGVPFKSCRPHFLKNKETNRNLELDMYNDLLKIGCEYNGIQHYLFSEKNAKMSYTEFRNQVKRDELKKKLCKENDVHLIVIPYNVNYQQIPLYILSQLPLNIRQHVIDSKIIDTLN